MSGPTPVTVLDLERSVDCAVTALRAVEGTDWSAHAGTLSWSRRQTVEHVVDDLLYYATALSIGARDRLVLWVKLEDGATAEEMAQAVAAGGAVLGAVSTAAAPGVTALTAGGREVDPEGYLALGIAETLLHVYDVTSGSAQPFTPPDDVCRRILGRLFRTVEVGEDSPWQVLLWATGRLALPGRPDVEAWEYDPA